MTTILRPQSRSPVLDDFRSVLPSNRDPAPMIEWDELAPIGGGWFRHGDRELLIDKQLHPSYELDNPLRPNQVHVHRLRRDGH
jgi:hypothetical protein